MSNSSSAKAKVLELITSILEVIFQQDWETFRCTLLSNPAHFKSVSKAISKLPEFNGMTLLNAMVRYNYNPPLDIALMIEICPDLPATKDYLGLQEMR